MENYEEEILQWTSGDKSRQCGTPTAFPSFLHLMFLVVFYSADIAPCLDDEFVQFPLRMRDWLKNVLLQLYEQTMNGSTVLNEKQRARVQKIYESQRVLRAGEGDEHPVEVLAKDFEKNYNMYIYPVHWQFAQVDQHPADRSLSRSELAPLRLPLVPMEHCISHFFTECDVDKDKLVSFQEWCRCFAIKYVRVCDFVVSNKRTLMSLCGV
uniref:EF-hand domain-containing protein n=1 Tax=Erpetoichthys calabaricus TaxID=27687 RepID=A0A8C4XCS3_ERPCA